jgi:tripartite-type tricarboxylate transporter receptor subunit TctC
LPIACFDRIIQSEYKGSAMPNFNLAKRKTNRLFASLGALSVNRFALASTTSYPTKPVKVIVPFPPGGATDLVARAIFDSVSKQLGQAFVIENKAGAAGILGTSELMRAPADGYTIGIATTSTHAVNPALNVAAKYNPVSDFSPIAQLVAAPGVLVVSPNLPVANFKEFVEYAKKNPGKLSYASAGIGSIGHLWGEMLKAATGIYLVHIPYRGASQAQTDVMTGVVQVGFDQVASALPMIKAGRVKALAIGSDKRLDSIAMVPTFKDVGYASMGLSSWFGVVGPAKLPQDIVEKLNTAINAILAMPDVAAKLSSQGLFPATSSPAAFSKLIGDETNRMRAIAKSANITIE